MNGDPRNCRGFGFGRGSRYFLAGFLILAGTLLFLSNLGLLPVRNIWEFWPLIVIGLGISRAIEGPEPIIRAFGGLIAAFGTLFLLVSLDVLRIRVHDDSWPLSLLLIFLGVAMLLKVLDKREQQQPRRWAASFAPLSTGITPDGFSDFSLLGAVKRRVDSADFRGGRALSVLGSLELDLREARIIEPSPIELEVSTVLGEAKVKVPETWRVRIHGASVMGNYEDKTVPGNLPLDAPIFVITGYSILGSVEVSN